MIPKGNLHLSLDVARANPPAQRESHGDISAVPLPQGLLSSFRWGERKCGWLYRVLSSVKHLKLGTPHALRTSLSALPALKSSSLPPARLPLRHSRFPTSCRRPASK